MELRGQVVVRGDGQKGVAELLERALEAAIDRALRIDRVRIGVVVRNPHTLRSLSFLNNHSLALPGRR